MHGNYRLAGLKAARTIGATGLVTGVMLAGGISEAPVTVATAPAYVPVPSPQPPSQGPLVIAITGQGPTTVIIGDPGGDGSGPGAVAA
ncbi:MAG TPA: hypothetical protein VFW50_20225 [Streptosporangiaceae bacterium]|nr:hypothetical protein [Streptosporangiaceae bacterium]